MIKSVFLENFQGHTNSFLQLHKGVNVITGTTDSGKSSIIKGIRWCKDNRPSGDAFKNWYSRKQDQVAVEITTDRDVVAIIRENDKTKYIVNGEDFDAIDTDVPSEVSDALNLADYNLQGQFDKYFLLQDSPGEVARKLNEYADMEIIDNLFSNIDSQIRATNIMIKSLKRDVAEHEKTLKTFVHLDEIEKIINSIDKDYEKSLEIDSSLKVLNEIVSTLESIISERQELNTIIALDDEITFLLNEIEKEEELLEKENALQAIITGIKEIQESKQSSTSWLELEKPCTELLLQIEESAFVKSEIDKLISIMSNLSEITLMKETETKKKDYFKEQYLTELSQIKTCPTCESIITEKIMDKIRKEL